jgi:phosphonate transport system substrate-binding protein
MFIYLVKGSQIVLTFVILALTLAACSNNEKALPAELPKLRFAGIPDQNATGLARRYDALTEYLSEELGVEVEFLPSVDYAATVTAFEQDEVQLGWFGGLTGVMARLEVPDSEAIAQRTRDKEFHSVFIVDAKADVESLTDLKGLTFTFGSELSTSGHLMPRFFLKEAGVDPEGDFKSGPSYSGSHDKTWKLVESGAFDAGALNEAVWQSAVAEKKVDTSKVRILQVTESYYDYNWTVRGDIESKYGTGFKEKLTRALLDIDEKRPELLKLFSDDAFIATNNDNYAAIENVARKQGIIE